MLLNTTHDIGFAILSAKIIEDYCWVLSPILKL